MNPLAKSIRPRINFTSGFDPSPRKRSVFGTGVPYDDPTLVRVYRTMVSMPVMKVYKYFNTISPPHILTIMEINYETIYDYLHCGKYPVGSNDNQKRATRNKAKKFIIQDGVLHYVTKSGLRQWVTNQEQQRKIIEACHADKLGGHFGRDKTREKFGSRFVNIILIN